MARPTIAQTAATGAAVSQPRTSNPDAGDSYTFFVPGHTRPLVIRSSSQNTASSDRGPNHESVSSSRPPTRPNAPVDRSAGVAQAMLPHTTPPNSLIVIGRRSGRDSGLDRHPIQVFNTSSPIAETQNGSSSHAAHLIGDRNQDNSASIASAQPSSQVLPWWLARPNQNQSVSTPSETYQSPPRSESPRTHFEPSYVSHAEVRDQAREQHHSAPTHQEPPPSQPARESHSESHAAAAAAASASHAPSQDHSSASSASSGRR
jgi:hypothetical protein